MRQTVVDCGSKYRIDLIDSKQLEVFSYSLDCQMVTLPVAVGRTGLKLGPLVDFVSLDDLNFCILLVNKHREAIEKLIPLDGSDGPAR